MQHKDRVFDDWCDVLISATGFLSQWKWPDIPGLDAFEGLRVHSAAWNEEYDYAGKRIAMIGNGSSAIQIMPELARKAKQVTNFIRSPTWITPGLGSAVIEGKTNKVYSEEEKKRLGGWGGRCDWGEGREVLVFGGFVGEGHGLGGTVGMRRSRLVWERGSGVWVW